MNEMEYPQPSISKGIKVKMWVQRVDNDKPYEYFVHELPLLKFNKFHKDVLCPIVKAIEIAVKCCGDNIKFLNPERVSMPKILGN